MKLFACLALLCLVVVGPAASQHKKKPDIGSLKQHLHDVTKQKAHVKAQLHQTKRQKEEVQNDLARVANDLSNLEDKLSTTENRLETSKIEQKQAIKDLAETQKELAKTKAQVAKRLRRIYVSQDAGLITAIVGTQTVGDIASRKFLLERIAAADHALFDKYTQLQAQANLRKKRCDDLVLRMASLAEQQRSEQGQLKQARAKEKVYLGELQDRQAELEELLNQFEEDQKQIQGQIESYLSRQRPSAKLPSFKGRLSRPINAPITSGFGYRYHPILHYRRLHAGIDFGAPTGTTIHAAADGVVIAAQSMRGYGNVVMIDHGGGISTVYGHCSRVFVNSGQHVKRGQGIAAVGMTGLATGPHLHFEVRIKGRPVNPLGRI